MTMRAIVDTNILIYFIRGHAKGRWLQQQLKYTPRGHGISVITETELLAKPQLSNEEKILIEECLQEFTIIPVDSIIARWAGLYRSQYRLSLGDALIVATARSLDLPLWTYNWKDFQKVKGVLIQRPNESGDDKP